MLFGGETAESYYEEGLTAAMKGDLPLAITRFERSLELDAHLYNARYQIGKCLLRMGKAEAALEQLLKAAKYLIQGQPLVDAGYALLLLNRVDEARNKYSEALQIKPEDPRAILGLARCAAAKEQWEVALNLTQHVIAQGHAHFDVYFLNAQSADKCDLPADAASSFSKAIELMEQTIDANPGQATGYFLRGKVHYCQEGYRAALDDFEEALSKAEQNTHYCAYNEHFTYLDILCMKGCCQQHLRLYDLAQETGRTILSLAPENETGIRLCGNVPCEDGKGSP